MTSKLGSIFSSDSSDADVSETDDNDDGIDLSLDKPVFLTSRGPVHMTAGLGTLFFSLWCFVSIRCRLYVHVSFSCFGFFNFD